MATEQELRNFQIINELRRDKKYINSYKKMTTTCRQIKGFKDNQAPCPRWGHFMYPLKEQLLVFGGYESKSKPRLDSNYHNDLWLFDLKTLKFTKLQQSGKFPPPCSNFTMNFDQYRNRLILFGGGSQNRSKLNSMYQLDLITYAWKKITWNEKAPYPWQRSYHCAEIIDKYLILFGGEFFQDLGDLWIFDLIQNKWLEVKFPVGSLEPAPRKFASSFVRGNKMYIFSGCREKYLGLSDMYSIDFTSFIERKETDNLVWNVVTLQNQKLINRWGHVCAIREDKVYVFGGRCKSKDLHNIVEIDLTKLKCQDITINGNIPRGRRKPGFCLRNNTLFCLSGFDGTYIKDFLYMPLMSLPKQTEEKQNNPIDQLLKEHFRQSKPSEFELNFDEDVLILEKNCYRKCLQSIAVQIEDPIKIKDFQGHISGNALKKNSLYFKFLLELNISELQIYIPMQILKQDHEKVIEYYLTYMQTGKIILDCPIKEITKFLDYLIKMADYYCSIDLEKLILRYKFQKFQKRLNSKRFTLKDITEEAANIYKTNTVQGEYAFYHMIIKIVEESSISNVGQLKQIMVMWIYPSDITWMMDMIGKYQFQIYQRILHKDTTLNENAISLPSEWIQNKKELRLETTLIGSNVQMI